MEHAAARNLVTLPLSLADLARFDTIIDARSPGEFALDHLPGAQSFPVLSDAERARIGTVNKEESAFAAKRAGAVLVARNIATHLERAFAEKPRSWQPLVYCWRGGMRSGAFVQVLRSVGWNAHQLVGGYKAFRGHVIAELETLPARFEYWVICGRTGSGKSRLLHALDAAGAQVLDLEALARHMGSVLGDWPGDPQPSQKSFETGIWHALSRCDPARPVFVEAESKRIGTLRVPERLMARMRQSACVELHLPNPARLALLGEEYAHFIDRPRELAGKLECLVPLHSRHRIEEWKRLALSGRWEEFTARMLEEHYDPAYDRSMFRNYAFSARALRVAPAGFRHEDFQRLAREMADWAPPSAAGFG
jgi:tRNA 2-selenouridine synthase